MKKIFETIYYASLECSNEIAKERHALIDIRLLNQRYKKDNAQDLLSVVNISLNLA